MHIWAVRSIGAVRQATLGALRPVQMGRVFGVPVFLAPSWALVAIAVTFSFAGIFVDAVPGTNTAIAHLFAFAYAVLLALCVLLHELGHVAVAVGLRLRVRRVVIFLLGGASEIDPEPERPRDELLVSAAGPVASAMLAALAWWIHGLVTAHSAIDVELQLLLWSNLSIAVFNALPGLPLDGGRVLRAAVAGAGVRRLTATRIAAVSGRVIAVLVAVSGLLLADGSWGVLSVVFSAAIGAFLWLGATQALVAARTAERLPGLSLDGLVRPAAWVPADLPLAEALRWAEEQRASAIVVMDGADRPSGIVVDALVAQVPPERRAWTQAGTVAAPAPAAAALQSGLTGEALLQACEQNPAASYIVVDGSHRAVGVVTATDIRAALEGPVPRRAAPVRP